MIMMMVMMLEMIAMMMRQLTKQKRKEERASTGVYGLTKPSQPGYSNLGRSFQTCALRERCGRKFAGAFFWAVVHAFLTGLAKQHVQGDSVTTHLMERHH